MLRRSFLKNISATALAATVSRYSLAEEKVPRIAYGGIAIECSTYSNILARMEDWTILSGAQRALARCCRDTPSRGCGRVCRMVVTASARYGTDMSQLKGLSRLQSTQLLL